MTGRPIYLDNNSTTRTDPIVVEKMLPFFSENFGNASSLTHQYGSEAAEAVKQARNAVAALLKCESKSIVFTSGATEANNLALLGAMRASKKGKHLVTTAAEHKAILDPAQKLSREGFTVTVLPVDRCGRVDPNDVRAAINEDTVLVSLIHGNNEVGTLNPIEEVGAICRKAGVLFHTDATQTTGKVAIDLFNTDIDLLSLSAHKMYGPKGIGALYVRTGTPRIKLEPLLEGGGHERRMRSGTLPVQQIVALGEACRLCGESFSDEVDRIVRLRHQLRMGLSNSISDIQFNGHDIERLPGNLHVSIPGVNSDALMMSLRSRLAISSGSACTTHAPEPSHVLLAMGIDRPLISSSLRFGIGRFNTADEIEEAIELVAAAANRLRRLSS